MGRRNYAEKRKKKKPHTLTPLQNSLAPSPLSKGEGSDMLQGTLSPAHLIFSLNSFIYLHYND
jgi:hypothetical protein